MFGTARNKSETLHYAERCRRCFEPWRFAIDTVHRFHSHGIHCSTLTRYNEKLSSSPPFHNNPRLLKKLKKAELLTMVEVYKQRLEEKESQRKKLEKSTKNNYCIKCGQPKHKCGWRLTTFEKISLTISSLTCVGHVVIILEIAAANGWI